jgi:hypothetical protein
MERRQFLAGVGATMTTALAGCGRLQVAMGERCGPGDVPLAALDDHDVGDKPRVHVRGTVVDIESDRPRTMWILSDGTARAKIPTKPTPSIGACLDVDASVGVCAGCADDMYFLSDARYEPI